MTLQRVPLIKHLENNPSKMAATASWPQTQKWPNLTDMKLKLGVVVAVSHPQHTSSAPVGGEAVGDVHSFMEASFYFYFTLFNLI